MPAATTSPDTSVSAPTSPLAYTPDGVAALITTGNDRVISARTLRNCCDSEKIPRATKIGKRWIIPHRTSTTLFETGTRVQP